MEIHYQANREKFTQLFQYRQMIVTGWVIGLFMLRRALLLKSFSTHIPPTKGWGVLLHRHGRKRGRKLDFKP
jgi:hypothetical protein